MLIPTISLQLAPGSSAADQAPAWSELGERLRQFSIKRGRNFETDTIQAGTGSFDCLNTDRALDPSYTRGPFYGRLKPNRQVRYRASIGGTTYDLFRGNVLRLPLSYTGPIVGSVTLDCVDRQSALATADISGTFPEQLTGARITAVLAAAGWTTSVVLTGWVLGTGALGSTAKLGVATPTNAIDAGRAYVEAITIPSTSPVKALQHIQEVADSDPGMFFVDGQGRGVYLDRSRFTPTPAAAVLTLTDDPSAVDATHVYYSDITPSMDIDRVMNDITVVDAAGVNTDASDAVSIDAYFRRSLSRQTQLRTRFPGEAVQLAGYLLAELKDAQIRIEQVTIPLTTTAAYQAILARELGDRITVLRTPAGSPVTETMTQDSILQGIMLNGTPSSWTATFQLSPLYGFTGWTLGTSQLGLTTKLAYV